MCSRITCPRSTRTARRKLVREDDGQGRGSSRAATSAIVGLNAPCRGRRRSGAWTRARSRRCGRACYDIDERVQGHEPQRRARVDVLPEHARLQRPAASRTRRTRTSRSSCCRPTTTGTSTSGAAPTPAASSRWRSGPIWDIASSWPPRCSGCGQGRATRSACPELPHMQGLPSYQSDYWDPFFAGVQRRGHRGVPAHRHGPRRHQHGARLRRWTTSWSLATQVIGAGACRTCCGARRCGSTPTCKIAFSEGGIGWIPFLLDRVDRHYAATTRGRGRTSATSCRARCSASTSLACFIARPDRR